MWCKERAERTNRRRAAPAVPWERRQEWSHTRVSGLKESIKTEPDPREDPPSLRVVGGSRSRRACYGSFDTLIWANLPDPAITRHKGG